jgi:hypothetical protein
MRNKHSRTLVATSLLVLYSSSALAQTAAELAECDRIRNAAEVGRTRAVERLNVAEDVMRQQVSTARSCLQRFGDAASRQSVTVAGFDISFLRDALFESACNVIQAKGTSGQLTPVGQLLSKVPGFDAQGQPIAQPMSPPVFAQPVYQPQVTLQPPATAGGQSVWDLLACRLLNNCAVAP